MKIISDDEVFYDQGKHGKHKTKKIHNRTTKIDYNVANALRNQLNKQSNEFLVKIIRIGYEDILCWHTYKHGKKVQLSGIHTIFDIILPGIKYNASHIKEFSFSVQWDRINKQLISLSESNPLKWAPIVYDLKSYDNIQEIADLLLTAIIDVQKIIHELADEAAYTEKNKIKLLKECYSSKKNTPLLNYGFGELSGAMG